MNVVQLRRLRRKMPENGFFTLYRELYIQKKSISGILRLRRLSRITFIFIFRIYYYNLMIIIIINY